MPNNEADRLLGDDDMIPSTTAQAEADASAMFNDFKHRRLSGINTSQSDIIRQEVRNAINGWSNAETQVTHEINRLHALPLADDQFGNTALGKLSDSKMQELLGRISKDFNISNITKRTIQEASLENPTDISDIFEMLAVELQPHDRVPIAAEVREARSKAIVPFNLALHYLVRKARQDFEAQYPIKIETSDTPDIVLQKTRDKNAAFQREVQNAKAAIQVDYPKLETRAIDVTTANINQSFLEAAKYEANFRTQKAKLQEHIQGNINTLEENSGEQQVSNTQHKLEIEERKITAIADTIEDDEMRSSFRWAVDQVVLTTRYNESPTDENKDALDRHRNDPARQHYLAHQNELKSKLYEARDAITEYSRLDAIKSRAEEVVQQIADNPESPAAELQDARNEYQQGLQSLSSLLHVKEGNEEYNLENASPDMLEQLQLQAKGLHKQYKDRVQEIHKQSGTDTVLKQLSKPLDALRATPDSWFGNDKRHSSARLDVLDMTRYQFTGDAPQVLINLNNLTIEVNQLLEKRETLERAIEANPSAAPKHTNSIENNTRELKSKMTELTNATKSAERSGYLQTHPDVHAWAEKASALQDAVNRETFRQRSYLANLAQQATQRVLKHGPWELPVNYLLSKDGYVDGINKDIKHNPNATKDLDAMCTTKHYIDEGGKFSIKEHKVNVKQADGSNKLEAVKFKKGEIKTLFEEFRQQYDLSVGRGKTQVRVSENSKDITYTWPDQEIKNKWLEFLGKRYQENRANEIAKKDPEHEASVDVEENSENVDNFAGINGGP